jgi:tetratricopeptide (TPR) repeat protein
VGWAVAKLASGPGPSAPSAGELIAKALAVDPQSALAHTVAALVAIRSGDAAAARAGLDRALALDPQAYQALCYRTTVELAAGNGEAALQAAKQAVSAAPGSALAHQALATAAFFTGDAGTAKAEAQIAVAAGPALPGAHLVLADVLVAEGELSDAAAEAGQAAALDPYCGPAYSAFGMIALAQNDLLTAERTFAAALERSPDLVSARTGMGVTYQRQGRLAKALEQQKASIALDSRAASTHNNLGAIYLAQGRLEEAVAEFGTAAELQPEWAMPHANLALAYLDLNRFAEAVREGELAVRLGEDSARVHTTLGRVYLEQNRVNKAWAALRRAVELDDTYALAHLQLAEVYLRLGRARDARREQMEGIALQPSAILETREYARTEARVEAGSFDAQVRTDGRTDSGRTSYFASAEYENNDFGRTHSSWERLTAQAILGHQPAADRAAAVVVSVQDEVRDRPGAVLANGRPEDRDYRSDFDGREGHVLARYGAPDQTRVTVKLGFRDSIQQDENPNSLRPDPKPFPRLEIRFRGPLAEARLDKDLTDRDHLTAGFAVSGEKREVSGVLGTPNPPSDPDPITWTPFADEEQRNAATFYVEHEHRFSDRTTAMLGGRLVTTESTQPVLRPKAWIRHDLDRNQQIVLLARPVLRDDVTELSPVDYWALDPVSPLDFAAGGFGQSYELQYQLMPRNGSLLRVTGFHRTLRNYIVDLVDPAWAPASTGVILDSATLTGVELEGEHWLSRDLSVGAWARYTDTGIDGAGGGEVPFAPKFLGQVRLDYLSPSGLRAGVRWRHVGSRWTDLANSAGLKAGGYDVVDVSAAYQVNLHTDLFLQADNLFDEEESFYPGYPDRGRWIHGGIEYRF